MTQFTGCIGVNPVQPFLILSHEPKNHPQAFAFVPLL